MIRTACDAVLKHFPQHRLRFQGFTAYEDAEEAWNAFRATGAAPIGLNVGQGSESSPAPTPLRERTPQRQRLATAHSPHTPQHSMGPHKPTPPVQHHASQSKPSPFASSSTARGNSVPAAPVVISAFFVVLSGWGPGVYMAL